MDIEQSFQNAMDSLIGFLPNLLGALLLLLIGFIVAKLIQAVVRKVLESIGLDRQLAESDANRYVDRVMPGASAANGISRVVFWLVFAFFIFSAIAALGIPELTGFMDNVLLYLPNIIVAILIFVIASLLAGGVAAASSRLMGDRPMGKIVAAVAPAVIMVIAMFMILQQLHIAEQIVQIAFAATMGALALGLALAFGLGGRGVAERLLEEAYRKGQEERLEAQRHRAVGGSDDLTAPSSAPMDTDPLTGGTWSSGTGDTRGTASQTPYTDDLTQEMPRHDRR